MPESLQDCQVTFSHQVCGCAVVQAEGHLPQQMDRAALQDARLALGGPNSEMVLSLLRTVAQQAADTGGGQASAC